MKTLRFTTFAIVAAAAVAVSGAALAGPVTPRTHAPAAATTAPAAASTRHVRTHRHFRNPLARHSAPAATTAAPAKK